MPVLVQINYRHAMRLLFHTLILHTLTRPGSYSQRNVYSLKTPFKPLFLQFIYDENFESGIYAVVSLVFFLPGLSLLPCCKVFACRFVSFSTLARIDDFVRLWHVRRNVTVPWALFRLKGETGAIPFSRFKVRFYNEKDFGSKTS